MIHIASFYRFHRLTDPQAVKDRLMPALRQCGVRGSVLLAKEGVNGTLASSGPSLSRALSEIEEICGLAPLEPRRSTAANLPFLRLKVRLKQEIVTMGEASSDPTRVVGDYVQPAEWNDLIRDPDVILVDVRNSYECRIGTFQGAIDPGTESFSEFPVWAMRELGDKKRRKIAMFCTGGIRCEKATSYLRLQGFENVFHLKGGILGYLESIPEKDSLWRGGCFVFDERVAVGGGLAPLDYSICHGCLLPVTAEERASPLYEEGVCCPACAATLTQRQKSSNRERQRQFELARSRGARHLGPRED